MKNIDWNKMSELGLIERINREILHPLGLAVSRTVETGVSEFVYVADDKKFNYRDDVPLGEVLTADEVHASINKITRCSAHRVNDQMMCKCGLQWDVDDIDPPECKG